MMRRRNRCHLASVAVLLTVLLPAATLAAAAPRVQEPAMRIGLTSAEGRVLTLSSRGGVRLVDAASGEPPWLDVFKGEVRVVLLGAGEVRTIYRVQVGSYAQEAGARQQAARLASEMGVPGEVHHDSQRRLYRVRLGAFSSRLSAAALTQRLVQAGFPDAWIAGEVQGDDSSVSLRLVDSDYREKAISRRRLLAYAASRSLLEVNGKRYRGQVEIFVDAAGRLRVVNLVNLEDYLRGVVPDEMGPGVYPEIEALKAQTVAARTYAVANRGQFWDEGFDICDTPRCQVYGGADSEHPLSDRAVAQSEGEVLVHAGSLVNAMFTSTCGGHTENVGNVFPEQGEAYLQGVRCWPEQAPGEVVSQVQGGALLTYLWPSPALARGVARLRVAQVVELDDLSERHLTGPLTAERWRRWRLRIAPLIGHGGSTPGAAAGGRLTWGGLAADVVELLDWQERRNHLLATDDAKVLLGIPTSMPLSAEIAAAGAVDLALMMRDALLDPVAVKEPWAATPPAAAGLAALARLLERFGAAMVREVRVAGVDGRRLLTRTSGVLELADGVLLLAATPTSELPIPVERLTLTLNEPVLVHTDDAGRVDYIEARRPFRSLGDDRFSSRYNWEVKVSRELLSSRLAGFLSVGDLVDLVVLKRGVSGRIATMEVVGTTGKAQLTGFDIRVALQLNETYFTVERLRDGTGQITAFVFAGKGWGHGVGMCQVGAYGMAVRGAAYTEILTHYYTDVRLESLARHPELLDTP